VIFETSFILGVPNSPSHFFLPHNRLLQIHDEKKVRIEVDQQAI
jgi:hypothetical protein